MLSSTPLQPPPEPPPKLDQTRQQEGPGAVPDGEDAARCLNRGRHARDTPPLLPQPIRCLAERIVAPAAGQMFQRSIHRIGPHAFHPGLQAQIRSVEVKPSESFVESQSALPSDRQQHFVQRLDPPGESAERPVRMRVLHVASKGSVGPDPHHPCNSPPWVAPLDPFDLTEKLVQPPLGHPNILMAAYDDGSRGPIQSQVQRLRSTVAVARVVHADDLHPAPRSPLLQRPDQTVLKHIRTTHATDYTDFQRPPVHSQIPSRGRTPCRSAAIPAARRDACVAVTWTCRRPPRPTSLTSRIGQ